MNFERIQYVCARCHEQGTIVDVFVHPTVLLLRGTCHHCGIDSQMRAIDLLALALHIDESVPLKSEKRSWHNVGFDMKVIGKSNPLPPSA